MRRPYICAKFTRVREYSTVLNLTRTMHHLLPPKATFVARPVVANTLCNCVVESRVCTSITSYKADAHHAPHICLHPIALVWRAQSLQTRSTHPLLRFVFPMHRGESSLMGAIDGLFSAVPVGRLTGNPGSTDTINTGGAGFRLDIYAMANFTVTAGNVLI